MLDVCPQSGRMRWQNCEQLGPYGRHSDPGDLTLREWINDALIGVVLVLGDWICYPKKWISLIPGQSYPASMMYVTCQQAHSRVEQMMMPRSCVFRTVSSTNHSPIKYPEWDTVFIATENVLTAWGEKTSTKLKTHTSSKVRRAPEAVGHFLNRACSWEVRWAKGVAHQARTHSFHSLCILSQLIGQRILE